MILFPSAASIIALCLAAQNAAWKAADIRKAIREGRKPQPGSGVLLKKYKRKSHSHFLPTTIKNR